MISHRAGLGGFAVLCLQLLVVSESSRAQSAAEHASVVSKTSTIKPGSVSPQPSFPAAPAAAAKEPSHLPVQSAAATILTNRRALEGKAGKDSAKLLIRSEPPGAQTWVNDLYVGATPVLLILPPGSFQLKLLGRESGFTEQRINLLAREQRTALVVLPSRYATSVRLR